LLGPGIVSTIVPGPSSPKAHTVARPQPISQLAVMLSNRLDCPVLDQTGLTGKYDFTIDCNLSGIPPASPPQGQSSADSASEPGLALAAALQQQLGFRMVASEAKIDVVIIDKVEKIPTEN